MKITLPILVLMIILTGCTGESPAEKSETQAGAIQIETQFQNQFVVVMNWFEEIKTKLKAEMGNE